jgi:hypothetical protein
MAKDPAFLFYPGDYLRDTQCLSEKSQVAYDRIMCEHMRNICISETQLNFFMKRLNADEKEEVMQVLQKVDGGYQIYWVAESITKRKAYSESRRTNRKGSKQKSTTNISTTYDSHMEIENAIENELVDIKENDVEILPPRYVDQFKPQPKYKVEHVRELPKQTLWYENVIRAYKISPDDFNRLVDEFISHCHSQGKDEDKTERDLKSHFTNWLGVKQKNGELKPKPKQQYKKFNFE